ncbi:MAG: PEP-CTERM sorting domain-containing protein [Phycisphaerales bacterium]|nr:PEP-CTERM sorting domain-containing protein [Phycisphaerales bacterium]
MIGSLNRFRKLCGLLSLATIATVMQCQSASADYVYYTRTVTSNTPFSGSSWTTDSSWTWTSVDGDGNAVTPTAAAWVQSINSVAIINNPTTRTAIQADSPTTLGGMKVGGAGLTINCPNNSSRLTTGGAAELWIELSDNAPLNINCGIYNTTGLRLTGSGRVFLSSQYAPPTTATTASNYKPDFYNFVGDISVENGATLAVNPGQEAYTLGGTYANGTDADSNPIYTPRYNDIVLNNGTYAFGYVNNTFGTDNSTKTSTLPDNFRLGTNGGTLAVVGTNKTLTISGVIKDDDPGAGNLYVNSNGAGNALILTGENTYTGDTVIQSGTLQLAGDGSIASSSHIIVGSSATLDVSGLNGDFQVAAGQTLSGDGKIIGDVTLDVGSILDLDAGLVITGNLDLPSMLSLIGNGPLVEGESPILTSISYGSLSVDGVPVDLNNDGQVLGNVSLPGFTGDFFTQNGGLYMNITAVPAVPEPASLMLLGLGAASLLARRRR